MEVLPAAEPLQAVTLDTWAGILLDIILTKFPASCPQVTRVFYLSSNNTQSSARLTQSQSRDCPGALARILLQQFERALLPGYPYP